MRLHFAESRHLGQLTADQIIKCPDSRYRVLTLCVQVDYFRIARYPGAIRPFTIDGQQVVFVRETTRELVRS